MVDIISICLNNKSNLPEITFVKTDCDILSYSCIECKNDKQYTFSLLARATQEPQINWLALIRLHC